MVVCKFFLQGECKFGENCRFEHQFPNGNISGVSQNQQSFHSNQNQSFVTKPANEVDTNTLITSVHNDMVSVEKSGQWLLTCYAPFKEKALFPGFEDQSFEEIRLGSYEAQKTNSLDQYKQQLQQALVDAKLKFKALQNPTKEIVEILRNIYNTQLISPSNSSSNQTSVFGNKISGQPSNNVFGLNTPQVGAPNSSTLFGQNVGNNSTSQVFAQTNVNQNTTGIFGQPSKGSLFGNNNGMFNQNTNQQNSTSIFANANQNLFGAINPSQAAKNIFSNSPQQQNSFQQTQQSLFTSVVQTQQNPSQNIFANNQNHQFGTSNMLTSQCIPLQGSLFNQVGAELNQSPQNRPDNTQGLVKSQIFNQQPNSIFTNHNTQISSVPFNNNSTSIFSNTQAQSSSSIFNSLGQQEPSKSIFGNSIQNTTGNNPVSLNIFGSGNHETNIIKDAYSKLEELSEDDIKWFKSNDLDIAAIPEKPPTYEMCFN